MNVGWDWWVGKRRDWVIGIVSYVSNGLPGYLVELMSGCIELGSSGSTKEESGGWGWWWFVWLGYVENEVDWDILSGVAYRKLRSLVRRDVGIVQWFLWKMTLLSGRIRVVVALLPQQKKAVGLCCLWFLRGRLSKWVSGADGRVRDLYVMVRIACEMGRAYCCLSSCAVIWSSLGWTYIGGISGDYVAKIFWVVLIYATKGKSGSDGLVGSWFKNSFKWRFKAC